MTEILAFGVNIFGRSRRRTLPIDTELVMKAFGK
jgi:hypothetical protein